MSTPLVELRGLAKRYPVVGARGDRLSALWRLLRGQAPLREVEVLADIDLTVLRGESLGIVGENGAGKSTLLKLITGTLSPSAGQVQSHGRIGALLELGAGFHPEYSGRDNVRMAAAIHGISGAALAEKLPEIEAFAEIGRYFDEPVKHYSSGMVVRLGFAVIAATRPDLLITDEVLAVGDERFQKKCIRWIDGYLADGGTLLLVSHSLYHVQKLCRHAIWLKNGRIAAAGDVHEVTQQYQRWLDGAESQTVALNPTQHALDYCVEDVSLLGADADGRWPSGGHLTVSVRLYSKEGDRPNVLIGLVRDDGVPVFGTGSDIDGVPVRRTGAYHFEASLVFESLQLLPGSYRVLAHAMDPQALRTFDTLEKSLIVSGSAREFGLVRLPHHWGSP